MRRRLRRRKTGSSKPWLYGTGKLRGAVAALSPVGAAMGQIDGYAVADYLIQHASQERRYARVPASTWDAAISYIRDADDAARLAASARNRLVYCYAIPLYHRAANLGDGTAGRQLARLLTECGDLDGAIQVLRTRTDAEDNSAEWLADLLAKRGDLDEAIRILCARADTGDEDSDDQLAGLLAKHGKLDALRARAGTGNRYASERLARLLADNGDLGEAALTQRAGDGDWDAARRLAVLLAGGDDLDGLRTRADTGDGYAASYLAELLAGHGDLEELRTRADTGDMCAARRRAKLLAERGDPERLAQILRARADAGDWIAAWRLSDLLAKHGYFDELRARADKGAEWHTARRLARLLAERGCLDELHARVNMGDECAGFWLADLLAEQGRAEEADRLRRFGLNLDGTIASQGSRGSPTGSQRPPSPNHTQPHPAILCDRPVPKQVYGYAR